LGHCAARRPKVAIRSKFLTLRPSFARVGPTRPLQLVIEHCPLRRLPWGFQVLVFILCRCARSPFHLPGGFLECERVLVIDRRVRETSLSQKITFRQSGNTSGGRPQTALPDTARTNAHSLSVVATEWTYESLGLRMKWRNRFDWFVDFPNHPSSSALIARPSAPISPKRLRLRLSRVSVYGHLGCSSIVDLTPAYNSAMNVNNFCMSSTT